jgi:antitoxin MazE
MKARIQKWGNSLALRIPKSFAAEAGFEQDSSVDVSISDGKLMIVPAAKTKWSLKRLLAHVTEDNLHHEIDTGTAAGKEIW